MPANVENSPVATGLEKVRFHSNLKERQCQRMLISHASKVMLKILQARLQQYVNHELPDVQADFIFFLRFKMFYFLFFILNFKIFNSYMRSQT